MFSFRLPGAKGPAVGKRHTCPYEAYVLGTGGKQVNKYMVYQVVVPVGWQNYDQNCAKLD